MNDLRGAAPEPVRLPLVKAAKFADRIVGELAEFCSRDEQDAPMIVAAGSIRRRRPECGDIDIVCLPKDDRAREALKARARRTNPWTLIDGAQQFRIILESGLGPVQVDFWFAQHPDKHMFGVTPGNFGTLLLFATGNGRHNIWLVKKAEDQGKRWSPNSGVWLGQHCLASETEEAIYRELGIEFLQPEDRER